MTENAGESCQRGRLSFRFSQATLLGVVGLSIAGITAWYGMEGRLIRVEDSQAQQNQRIDSIQEAMEAHHALPAHPVAVHVEEELERRIARLEQLMDIRYPPGRP